MMKKGQSTRWGIAQSVQPIADGMDWVETMGHGGIVLHGDKAERAIRRCAEIGWKAFGDQPVTELEEDCDWAVAVLLFPDDFTHDQRVAAFQAIRGMPDYFKAWFQTSEWGRMGVELLVLNA